MSGWNVKPFAELLQHAQSKCESDEGFETCENGRCSLIRGFRDVCKYLEELEEGGAYEFLEGTTDPDFWTSSDEERNEITNRLRLAKGLRPIS